jgi:hypothetical protein
MAMHVLSVIDDIEEGERSARRQLLERIENVSCATDHHFAAGREILGHRSAGRLE